MYVTLDILKKHLNIEDDFEGDDEYLMILSGSAEEFVAKYIERDLKEVCEENDGELPLPILHAILILVANFYANRESKAYTQTYSVPLSFDALLGPYKNYNKFFV